MANSKIPNLNLSDTLNTQRLKFNQLLDSVGDVSTLTTTAGPVTDAINELDAELGTITSGAMGTTASTVSGAIAELDGRLDSINNTELLSPRSTLSDSSATNIVRGNLQVDTDLHVGGNATMSGTLTVDGQVTFKAGSDNNISLGDAATDTITLTGEVNSNVVPDADDTYDLGSPTKEWRHVYVDGTVNADNVAADSATIGTLTVTGDTTFNNTITVQDSAYITGDLDVGGQATLASAAVSDLTSGRVVIAGTSGELQDDGKLTWNTTTGLKTTEALTVQDSAYVTGNLNVGGNLDVAGNITLGGDITIGDANTDNVAFNADINSSIIPNTDNTYDLGSASQEWRHVYVDGTVNADNVAADSATIGTLKVTDLTNNRVLIAGASGKVEDDTNFTFDGTNLTVGNTSINRLAVGINTTGLEADSATIGFLTVTDSATFLNTITVQDSAYITGDLVLGSNLKTPSSFILGAAATSISIGSYNTGTTTIQHDLIVDSNLTVHGLADLDSTSITGNLIMNTNKFTVDHLGNTVIAGTLDVNDVITLDSAVIANLEVTGTTTLENALTVQDSAYITGNTDIGGNLTVGGGFTVSGTFTTTGTTRNAASYVIVNDQVPVSNSNRAGLAVDRPSTDSAVMQWNENGDYWEAGTTNNLRQLARQDDSAAFTNLYVGGNLTVNGTTTTVNSTTVEIGDNIILLNDSLAGSGIANIVDAGIEIERGTSTNVQLLWDESEDYWVAANDGSNTLSRIATAAWLDATAPISFNSSTGNISHDNTTRTNVSTSESPGSGGSFDVVDSIQSNSKGHITQVATRTITLPTSDNYVSWTLQGDGGSNQTINSGNTVDIAGGTYITTTAGATDTLTVAHDNTSRTNVSTSESPTFGGSFDIVDSIQSNATGHVTQVATRTITLPSPNDATITISGGTDLETGGSFTTDQSGNETITLNHSNTTRTNVSTSESPGYGGSFDVVDSIQSNARGHITQVATRTITLPASDNTNQLTVWYIEDSDGTEKTMDHNKELKILGDYNHINTNFGSGTGTDGSPYDLKISHALSSAAGATIGGSITSGGSFSAVTGVTFDEAGHVDSVQTTNFSVFSDTNTDTLQSISSYETGFNQYISFVGSTSGAQTGRTSVYLKYNPTDKELEVGSSGSGGIVRAETFEGAGGSGAGLTFKGRATGESKFVFQQDEDIYSIPTNLYVRNIDQSPSNGDSIGSIHFSGENGASSFINYASVTGIMTDATTSSEDGNLTLSVKSDGSDFTAFQAIGSSTTTIGAATHLNLTADSDIYLKPTGDDVYMQGTTSGEELWFNLGTSAQTITASDTLAFATNSNEFNFSGETTGNTSRPPNINIINNDTIPVDDQTIGQINFVAENDTSAIKDYAKIQAYSSDVTNGTEDGQLQLIVLSGDTDMVAFDAKGDWNTIVRSPASTHIYLDAGDDIILDANAGIIDLYHAGSQDIRLDVATTDTLKLYTGTSTLNSTWSGNDLTVQGDVNSVSDVRTKENIETVENGLDLVSQLRGVWYNKIGEEDRKVGVIAQEVEEVLPEVVHTDTEGMKAVDYGKMVGVLIEAIKELKQEIEELKSK